MNYYGIVNREIQRCRTVKRRRNTGHIFVNSLALYHIYTYYRKLNNRYVAFYE